MEPGTEVWLVRHGESTWNAERRFQGSRDAPLSARGRAQARALAAALAGRRFDALYTSPLARARDTAAACAARLGLAPVLVPALGEIGLGEWEGLPVEAVVARAGDHYARWLEAPGDHAPPGGEPVRALQARVVAVLETWAARHPGQRVLAVSHGGAIASALVRFLALGPNALWRLRLDNASVTRLLLPAGRLLGLNERLFDPDGLPAGLDGRAAGGAP